MRKLRDADAMLAAGKDEAAVLQALEVSESTLEAAGSSAIGAVPEPAALALCLLGGLVAESRGRRAA